MSKKRKRGLGKPHKQIVRAAPFVVERLEQRWMLSGGWSQLEYQGNNGASMMMLLPDGNVLVQNGLASTSWCILSPDSSGSYLGGTFGSFSTDEYGPGDYASAVLPDGRVFVAGGEYTAASDGGQVDSGAAEIYDPSTNAWSSLANSPAPGHLGDSESEILQDASGDISILCGGVSPFYGEAFDYSYDVSSNTWTTGPQAPADTGYGNSEASWVKLPDGSILAFGPYDPGTGSYGTAQRLLPGATQWISAGNLPVQLCASFNFGEDKEIGPAVLLPDGQVFFIGATGNTALYTPPAVNEDGSASTDPGTWTVGPQIIDSSGNVRGPQDGSAAILPDGNVLFAAGDLSDYSGSTELFEYYPTTNTIAQVQMPTSGPSPNLTYAPYNTKMLDLPTGQVLFLDTAGELWVYSDGGTPVAGGQPAISSIVNNNNGTLTLTGTNLK